MWKDHNTNIAVHDVMTMTGRADMEIVHSLHVSK